MEASPANKKAAKKKDTTSRKPSSRTKGLQGGPINVFHQKAPMLNLQGAEGPLAAYIGFKNVSDSCYQNGGVQIFRERALSRAFLSSCSSSKGTESSQLS
ncbi:hypothetical protein N7467_011427 [Penicillium canescens]|nr:hypothetical protein N7467_011427 [Penicillium canescens]